MLTFYATFDATDCTTYTELTWDQCVSYCQQNSSCYYALHESTIECAFCGYGSVTDIVYSSIATDAYLSLKSNATSCSTAQQLLAAQQIDELEAKIPTCPTGWTTFNRAIGNWCMIFYKTAPPFTITTGQSYCQTLFNATLSGFQTLAEVTTMYNLALSTYGQSGLLFIGASRTPSCYSSNVSCTELSSFYWTDGVTTGTDGFYGWGTDQPSNYSNRCANLNVSATGLADISCDTTLSGVVCGKLAT